MHNFHILIPARLASTRLPNKPLADVSGLPLVVRVLQRALAIPTESVHVVTDHPSIASVVEAHGGAAIMTRVDHSSGTDRLVEAVSILGLDDQAVVVNVQGDEPLMPVRCIEQVANLLTERPQSQMSTLFDNGSREEWLDPNVVKLVTDASGHALCFSRAPIPYSRDADWPEGYVKRHIGLYAYRVGALKQWPKLPHSSVGAMESLEQWKALEAGWKIACGKAVEPVPSGVDSPEDLARVSALFTKLGGFFS